MYDECLKLCDRKTEPVPCIEECQKEAKEIYGWCVRNGIDESECKAQAAAYLRECVSKCPRDERPDPSVKPGDVRERRGEIVAPGDRQPGDSDPIRLDPVDPRLPRAINP
jgi:hypothetical protein